MHWLVMTGPSFVMIILLVGIVFRLVMIILFLGFVLFLVAQVFLFQLIVIVIVFQGSF